MIAAGVRTLLGVMPRSSITVPIADFVFRSLALSSNITVVHSHQSTASADAVCFGVGGTVQVYPVNICAATNLGAVSYATSGSYPGRRIWMSRTPYVKVTNLRLTIVSTTLQRSQSGLLAVGWVPFTTDTAEEWYRNTTFIPSYRDVTELPSHVVGKPLYLNCPLRGFCAQPRSPNDALGRILLSYLDNARTSSSQLTAEDFSCEIQMLGVITLLLVIPTR